MPQVGREENLGDGKAEQENGEGAKGQAWWETKDGSRLRQNGGYIKDLPGKLCSSNPEEN